MKFITSSPPVVRAALWMVGTLSSFTAMGVGGRELGRTMTAPEVSFFRASGGLLIVLFLLWRSGYAQLRTQRLPLHIVRNCFHFAGQTLWFLGLTLMPLAIVFALEFTIPIWSAIFAMIFLHEQMNLGRALAIILGFIGVLVIVQPGTAVFDPHAIIVLVAAIGFAASNICTKPMSRTETPLTIIFYMNLIQMPLGLVASAYFGWVPPSWADLPWIAIVGAAGLTAHFCMTRAFMLADATVVLPFDYLRLPLAAILGFLLYQESVGLALAIGAAIMFSGNFYSLRYEARRKPKPA